MPNAPELPKMYGWFSSPDQEVPDYDPPRNAPCPHCGEPLHEGDVRTHSFANIDGGNRSYFYRTHKTCDLEASDSIRDAMTEAVIRQIIAIEGE